VSEKPTDPAELDDIGDRYRRDSANDAGRPAATVRVAVLARAAQLAAKNRADRAAAVPPRRAAPRRFRPVLYGSLAAAAFAGVLMTPYLFTIGPPTLAPKTSVHSENSAVASRVTPIAPAESPVAPTPSSSDETAGSTVAATTPQRAQSAAPSAAPSAGRPAAPANESRFATARAAKPAEASADAGAVADLEARDADGRTALMLAVTHGQLAAVEALLAHGADPNAADIHGVTPLQAALAARQPAIAAALRRAGAQ
jgi:hypothetical protein